MKAESGAGEGLKVTAETYKKHSTPQYGKNVNF